MESVRDIAFRDRNTLNGIMNELLDHYIRVDRFKLGPCKKRNNPLPTGRKMKDK